VLLESSIESYDASLARYRSGVGDIVELLNAQTTLAEGRAEQVQATTDIFTSYADLINAMGTEILSPEEIVIEEDVVIDSKGGEELINEEN
jgi:outer membrane protein TolC